MDAMQNIKIGTRKSPLALAQANEVRDKLLAAWPGVSVELVEFVTSGDKFLDRPLSDIGGKGLFTKEIEEALLDKRIDIAVHSMKDMPTVLPKGLIMGAILEREDVRDVLVGNNLASLKDLKQGAVVGTSSLRRAAQMKLARPDITIVGLRGNVQTRLRKLEEEGLDATMLAQAGLNRLKLTVPGAALSVEEFLPAIAQGAIGIECRDDVKLRELLAPLNHRYTQIAVDCERAFLKMLDGSCRTPIAGYAQIADGVVSFKGLIAKPDGSHAHEVAASSSIGESLTMGKEVGKALLAKAGKDFLSH